MVAGLVKLSRLTDDLRALRTSLAAEIQQTSIVRNRTIGYVECRDVNHLVKPSLLRNASSFVLEAFIKHLPEELKPQKVIGVPDRGKEFANTLGILGDFDMAVAHREEQSDDSEFVEYDPVKDILTIGGVPSFRKENVTYTHFIRGVRPGDQVLVADDFSALGRVSRRYLQAFREMGIRAALTFLVAKDFFFLDPPQIGYRNLLQDGVAAIAVVRFTDIKDGQVIATAEDIHL